MLALIHHLLVNERVPLTAILDLAADLIQQRRHRRVHRSRRIRSSGASSAAVKRSLPTHTENFEAVARRRFDIESACDSAPTRRIYLLRKREL